MQSLLIFCLISNHWPFLKTRSSTWDLGALRIDLDGSSNYDHIRLNAKECHSNWCSTSSIQHASSPALCTNNCTWTCSTSSIQHASRPALCTNKCTWTCCRTWPALVPCEALWQQNRRRCPRSWTAPPIFIFAFIYHALLLPVPSLQVCSEKGGYWDLVQPFVCTVELTKLCICTLQAFTIHSLLKQKIRLHVSKHAN
jgi:hypothetical protein